MTIVGSAMTRAVDEIFADDPYVKRSPVTFSMLGRCRRRVAYARAGTDEEKPEDDKSAAWLGQTIHGALLGRLQEAFGGEIEKPVEWDYDGLLIKGTSDWVLPDQVVDLKTVSSNYFPVVAEKIPWAHRLQATGYALATEADDCTLLYVNRGDGSRFTETWATEEFAAPLMHWLDQTTDSPEQTPRDGHGPGLSMMCDSCPFLKQCWGPTTEGQEPQGVLANEHGIEMALAQYAEARARESAAKDDKDFWRQVLVGSPAGDYGEWTLGWSKPAKPRFDVAEGTRLLEEAGLPIPMTGGGGRSITVRPHRDPKKTEEP